MSDAETPHLDDVMDYSLSQSDVEKRWMVLYEEDYHNLGIDPDGNLAILVDLEQSGEVLRLASEVMADLTPRESHSTEPIEDMIAELESLTGDSDD